MIDNPGTGQGPPAAPSDDGSAAAEASPQVARYPMAPMPFVAAGMPADERFADALEDFLINYGYNTARAYMADLLDIYDWAQVRDLAFFELDELQLKPYLALLRRRKYSESTIRRRLTAWRQFRASLAGNNCRRAARCSEAKKAR